MAAHQAPPSLGFSRQEHWSGLPLPPPMHESESEVVQLCPTLSDPMDCSPPGSSVHGTFQARVLEWGAIAFSEMLSRVQLFVIPQTTTHQAPLSMELSRQEYWRGLSLASPGDLPNPGIKPFSYTGRRVLHPLSYLEARFVI